MSDQLAFILTPSTSSNLQQSQTLNLLPFALGPSSNPYASTSAPISTYFQPRSCPPNHSSLKEGTPIAAFRGRQLVGQNVEVPTGYKGLILQAGPGPDRGGSTEIRGKAKEGKWPLTPATSVASGSSVVSTSAVGDDGVRRSPRKARGAGQIALSKPRQTFKRGLRKRLRLDSESEDDESAPPPVTTPSKKHKGKAQTTPIRPPTIELPEIKIQSPTPRKPIYEEEEPLRRRLRGPTGMEETDPYGGIKVELESAKMELDENVVPSPATEDLPPLFKVESKTIVFEDSRSIAPVGHGGDGSDGDEKAKSHATGLEETASGDSNFVRQLRPVSTFNSITLWTADAPLAGFKQDELLDRETTRDESRDVSTTTNTEVSAVSKPEARGEGTAKGTADAEAESSELNQGWWRTGGAGEGGDEFVRGMGEWLGLVHMINDPIYLRDLPKEDDEDDEP